MNSPVLVAATTLLQGILYILLLLKLWRANLATKYKAFTTFVIFELVRSSVAALIPRKTNTYAEFFLLTEPIVWLLFALVTLEVYQSVFRTLPGISRFTRYVIVSATGVAIAISTISLMLHVDTGSPFRTLELYFTLERAIFLSLLTFVLMLVAFLSWYPVPVHTNAVVYSGVFALFFGVKTAVFLVRTVAGPHFSEAASLVNIIASLTSCLLWTVLLSSAGEARRTRSARRMSEERAEELVAQLKSIDAALRSVPD